MKTPYQIAKELKVSPQAVYKRMNDKFNNQYAENIQRTTKGTYVLDGIAEEALKGLFNKDIQPSQQPTIEPDEQRLSDSLNLLHSENTFLRARVEALEHELTIERTHSRGQTDKITELAESLARLASNAQQLHGAEIIPRLSDGGDSPDGQTSADEPLPGWWARLMGKGKAK
ncbi:MAG: hypothetical protein FWF81_04585 [Defluviitaleaceae bacterium]|nr:hypothetical protein [Defluviitaleaceae bacterium]